MSEFTLPNGQKIDVDDRLMRQFEDFVLLHRNAELVSIGQVIAVKMPMLYGNVQFNLQGGKCVNVNVNETVRPTNGHEKRKTMAGRK